jgi:hypothetical protein
MNTFDHGMTRIFALFDAHPIIPVALTIGLVALWFVKRKRRQQQDDPPPV